MLLIRVEMRLVMRDVIYDPGSVSHFFIFMVIISVA